MPEQMFHYRAASWFKNRHCSEVTMGMMTSDEAYDMPDVKQVESFEVTQDKAKVTIQEQAGSENVTSPFEIEPQAQAENTNEEPQDLPEDFDQTIEDMTIGTPSPEEQAETQAKIDEQKKKLAEAEAKNSKKPDFLYICENGHGFDVPKKSGKGANQKPICPTCLTDKIEATEDIK